MNMRMVAALAGVDRRNINRDSLLRFFLLFPFLIGLLMRWLLPTAQRLYGDQFDLTPYTPLIASMFALIITPGLAGTIIGLLLLDEKDAGTLLVLRVTPLRLRDYLVYRLAVPVAISVAATYIMLWLAELIPVSAVALAPPALAAAFAAPLYALILATFAHNKVQGLALMKGMGIFFLAPIVAWFTPEPWQWLLGVMPTYWPAKAFWQMAAGESYGPALAMTVAVAAAYVWLMMRRFERALG